MSVEYPLNWLWYITLAIVVRAKCDSTAITVEQHYVIEATRDLRVTNAFLRLL